MRRSALAGTFLAIAFATSNAAATADPAFTNAASLTGPSVSSGTQFTCTLHQAIDSATVRPGSTFSLIVDPTAPAALRGAKIVGTVTDVVQPAGMTRARIGFLFNYVRFANGEREPIRAQVLSARVVARNTAQTHASRIALPAMTPSPVAWQMNIPLGGRASTSSAVTMGRPASNAGSTGGWINATSGGEAIVIPAGVQPTLRLLSDLRTP